MKKVKNHWIIQLTNFDCFKKTNKLALVINRIFNYLQVISSFQDEFFNKWFKKNTNNFKTLLFLTDLANFLPGCLNYNPPLSYDCIVAIRQDVSIRY